MNPMPSFALSEQWHEHVAAHRELLSVRAEPHDRVVDGTVARIEDGAALILQSIAPHVFDECQSQHWRVPLASLALGAPPSRGILTVLRKHLDDLPVVGLAALVDPKPSARLARFIGFFP